MDLYFLSYDVFPVLVAVIVIAISVFVWRRKSEGEQELSESEREKIQSLTADKDGDNDEITLDEASKFLEGAGLIKAQDIYYLPEDERENIAREVAEQPLTEVEQKKKIKEMNVNDASNIQTYYKSSRLGIREIEKQMTTEELAQEQETQKKQLEEIFKLLETDKDKFGLTTMDDLQAQMKLYTR